MTFGSRNGARINGPSSIGATRQSPLFLCLALLLTGVGTTEAAALKLNMAPSGNEARSTVSPTEAVRTLAPVHEVMEVLPPTVDVEVISGATRRPNPILCYLFPFFCQYGATRSTDEPDLGDYQDRVSRYMSAERPHPGPRW